MKKLLGMVVFSLFLSGNTFANIFDCKINDFNQFGYKVKINFTIVVEDNIQKTLTTVNNNELRFDSDDHIVISNGNNGKIIITESSTLISKGSYDLFVFMNQKKSGTDYFKAIFSQGVYSGLIHTLSIDVTEKDMPVYLNSSWDPRQILKGTCK